MTSRRAWWLTTLSTISALFAAISLGPAATFAQQAYLPGVGMPQPGIVSPGGAGGQPQMMWNPSQMPGYGAYGPGWNGVALTGYNTPPPYVEVAPGVYREAVGPPGGELTAGMVGGEMGDDYGDESNCPNGSGRHYLGNPLALLAPYSETGQCTTHWFDIEAEALYLGLKRYASPFLVFSKDNNAAGANRIISGDLDPAEMPGFRVTGAKQVGPGSDLEFTYLGLFQFNRVASADDPSSHLMSVYSNFNQLNNEVGLQHFDFAYLHQMEYANTVNSFELNYRRRWQGSNCLFQGSWLFGARYINLTERLQWLSLDDRPADLVAGRLKSKGSGHYDLDTENSMPGGQIGGDLWLCLLPGLNVGVEGKTALFGSFAQQSTSIYSVQDGVVNTLLTPEHLGYAKVPFVGELSLMVNYRISPKLTVRGGYEVFYLDGLALAMQNFNPVIPNYPQADTTRTPYVNTSGSLLYSGFTIGGEWMW